jgi:hypothetical protein
VGLIERHLRLGIQIKSWPLGFSHGESYGTGHHLVCPVLDTANPGDYWHRKVWAGSMGCGTKYLRVIEWKYVRANLAKSRQSDRHARFSGLIVALPSTVGLAMKRPSDTQPSPLRRQAADALRRARKLLSAMLEMT